jgi:exosortase/archaeosortase family protein
MTTPRTPPPAEEGIPRPPSVRAFVLRFLAAFVVLEGVVYLLLWRESWFAPYASANARLTAALLGSFVDGVSAREGLLSTPLFAVQVRPGCDAYQASAVLLAGILAFPASPRQRLIGALLGVGALQTLNILRLAALLVAGAHDRALFERMHLEILPLVFVAASLALLLGWALWVRRRG